MSQIVSPPNRTYSRYTREATTLLGKLVALGRKRRRMSAQALVERIGISRGTLQRLERGDPKVEIGTFFEAAAIVGVVLFDADLRGLSGLSERTDDRLSLLPKYIREPSSTVDDDF